MISFLHKHLLAVCCVVAVALAGPYAVQAQTPTVTITNTSRSVPGTGLWFYVGDDVRVEVHGAPNSTVYHSGHHDDWYFDTLIGYTDGSGTFIFTGTESTVEIGNWYSVWSVGGVQATPTFSFPVWASPSYPCDARWSAPYWMYSYDYYHTGEYYPYYQQRWQEWAVGYVESADCYAYGVDLEWDYPQYLQINSSYANGWYFDAWIQDSGWGRATYDYYPIWSFPTLEALMYNYAGQYSVETADIILLIYRVDD
jgi:hypothetical protein